MFRKKRYGISAFMSVVLLMLLAVAAGSILYTYVMGTLGSNLDSDLPTGKITMDSATMTVNTTTVYVRNVGSKAFELSSIYIDDALISTGYTIQVDGGDPSTNLIDPDALGTVTAEKTGAWTSGTHYKVKLVGLDGTTLTFNIQAQ
jgi:hypothetical protein